MGTELTSVNWTVIGGILAVVVPICLTALSIWLKNFSKPDKINGLKEKIDSSNSVLSDKIDNLTEEIEKVAEDFEKKLNGFRESMEERHFGDHDEIVEKVARAKEDVLKLTADIMVLQTNQINSDKSLTDIKEDYKDLAKRLEGIVDKIIAFISTAE